MRVISGTAKGRALKAVAGTGTRPTTDKVKEAMFSTIGPYFDGGLVLDLFAGTGSLGIEALSRGMDRGIFIDSSRRAIQTIEDNLQQTKLGEQSEVFLNDATRALKALSKREMRFNLVFIDPPYEQKNAKKKAYDVEALLTFLETDSLLHHHAMIVIEHDVTTTYLEQYGSIQLIKNPQYGDTALSIYDFKTEQ